MRHQSSSDAGRRGRGGVAAAALMGMILAGGTVASPAWADQSQADGSATTRMSASQPQPLLGYDFSALAPGAKEAENTVSGSSFGPARILDADGRPTGAVKTDDALLFDGTTYVKLPDDILSGRANATVSIRVRNDSFNASGPWTYLWSLGGTGQQAVGSWTVSTHTSLYTSITSKANGQGETYLPASKNLPDDRFSTLTATIDGKNNMVRLYINGLQVAEGKATVNPAAFGDHHHNVIGQSRYPGIGDALFHGSVQSFAVYPQALDADQIVATLPSEDLGDLIDQQATSLAVPAAVDGDFNLPVSTSVASVRWTSSAPGTVSVNAATGRAHVVPGKRDVPVTLTARLQANRASRSSLKAKAIQQDYRLVVRGTSKDGQNAYSRVSVHDPSVVKAGGRYYVFGSHRAWARSTDLKHWEPFTNNLSWDYQRILDPIWKAWPKQSSNPDVTGNMWAPEVYYNATMKKWCMYLSLNGGGFPFQKSVIVLLTADDIEGDWSLVGPVVYSGFQKSNVAATDVPKVLGPNADLSRYASLTDTGINAIDACVKDDGQGGLWMSFGSWFGGIWMIRLDPRTGLRDYSTTYPTQANQSDAYYGHKLAGGFGNSGEGTALVHQGDWWYLMLSYGGLGQTGGYQMREFRSRSITGPYLDQNGKPAVYGRAMNDLDANRGLRIDSSFAQPGQDQVLTSQGGNALLVDDDRVFNVYHTRFVRAEGNLEEHQVRVKQMVQTPDGWLVMTPFEYRDSVGRVSASQVVGDYQVVVHDPVRYYAGSGLSSPAIYRSVSVSLLAGGRLGGQVQGSWKATAGNLTIKVDSADPGTLLHGVYRARLGRQLDEQGHPVVFFSGLGGDVFTDAGADVSRAAGAAAIWGSRPLTDAKVQEEADGDANHATVPAADPTPAPAGRSGKEGKAGRLPLTGSALSAPVAAASAALVLGLGALVFTAIRRTRG
ncbi:family 43 glycosylhydrolase [uncultured Bifidobacterium sp.]|uniref:family 43 glycosylhydrolase n=1 Tax=uncultured Bifidobacterium sp. TaxID=165187 RepID=UPI00259589CA|nr:family 43 glycosylhydrolase [uncultured Bifidobacterium sp.]